MFPLAPGWRCERALDALVVGASVAAEAPHRAPRRRPAPLLTNRSTCRFGRVTRVPLPRQPRSEPSGFPTSHSIPAVSRRRCQAGRGADDGQVALPLFPTFVLFG